MEKGDVIVFFSVENRWSLKRIMNSGSNVSEVLFSRLLFAADTGGFFSLHLSIYTTSIIEVLLCKRYYSTVPTTRNLLLT